MKQKNASGVKGQSSSLVRASISFPPELYRALEESAAEKKVSLAWVVRDAAEKYVASRSKTRERRKNSGIGLK